MFLQINRRRKETQEAADRGELPAAVPPAPAPAQQQGRTLEEAFAAAPQKVLLSDATAAKADRVKVEGVYLPQSNPARDADPEDLSMSQESDDGTRTVELSAQEIAILAQYKNARVEFGMSRLRMGSFLCLIRDNKLWQGQAENWEAFLADQNINVHAARQYISVAKTFIFEMDLPEETLARLSVAGISALEKASKVINESNREEVVAVLAGLSEKDAMQRIIELSTGEQPQADKPSLKVLRLLKEFYEMPPDLQMEFIGKVDGNRRSRERRNAAEARDSATKSGRGPRPG